MNEQSIQQFYKRIELERAELQVDLKNLSFNKTESKVGDFGCGAGYISWCLLLEIPKSECVGIDKFSPLDIPPEWDIENYFQTWDIDSVQNHNKNVLDHIKSETSENQENDLLREFRSIVTNENRQPIIRKG